MIKLMAVVFAGLVAAMLLELAGFLPTRATQAGVLQLLEQAYHRGAHGAALLHRALLLGRLSGESADARHLH